jgi:hypothetical protein
MESLKFKLFTLAILLSVGTMMQAQKGEFGVRFMPTFSAFDVNTSSGGTIDGEVTFGLGAGVLLALNITDHVGIQGEVIYNKVSQKYAEDNVNRRIDLKYVNIPLLLSLNTGKTNPVNFNFVVGPQLGISVGSEFLVDDGNNNDPNAVLSVKKGDLGIAYGAGVSFGLTPSQTFRLGLGFRGVYGVVDISDNSNNISNDSYYLLDRSKIKTYSGYIGLSFLF